MTIGSKMILSYLKTNYGKEFTKAELAEALHVSLPTVTGSINGLVKRGFVEERVESYEIEPATETRKAKIGTVRYEKLNEAGLAFDPEEEEAAQAAAKEAAKAAKAAAKAAKMAD